MAWVTQNGKRSAMQKLFLESFNKSEGSTFKYVWVRMIWTFAGEQLTVRMQSLTLKGASNKEALGCDVELSTEVSWEKDSRAAALRCEGAARPMSAPCEQRAKPPRLRWTGA